MLAKLQAALAKLTHREAAQKAFRRRAIARMKGRVNGAVKARKTAKKLDAKAAKLRIEGYELSGVVATIPDAERKRRRAERIEKRAGSYRVKAGKEDQRADDHKAAIRKYTQRIEKIDTSEAAVEKALAHYKPVINFDEETVTGGTFEERWNASLNMSWQKYREGIRAGRYSQEGTAVLKPWGPGPWSGRDDCSSFARSHCKVTGADDPSGHDFSPEGFTGDMAEAHGRWKQVTKAEMMAAGQGYIIYGAGTGHHVECFAPLPGEPERTIGHGSPPCDPGHVMLFGPNEYMRYYIYVE